jgi:hypothetical protein
MNWIFCCFNTHSNSFSLIIETNNKCQVIVAEHEIVAGWLTLINQTLILNASDKPIKTRQKTNKKLFLHSLDNHQTERVWIGKLTPILKWGCFPTMLLVQAISNWAQPDLVLRYLLNTSLKMIYSYFETEHAGFPLIMPRVPNSLVDFVKIHKKINYKTHLKIWGGRYK